MGLMIDGKWDNDARISSDDRGRFIREASKFRHWVTADGSPGPSGDGMFKAEPDRYHLFVSYSCPWAHRTILMRKLKNLDDIVTMSIADRPKIEGWAYSQPIDDLEPCPDGIFRLHQIYQAAQPGYTGKVTVPTLWDRKRRTIVNNESSEIIRMFNSAFNEWTNVNFDFYPEGLRNEIDEINRFVYEHLNNGVYRTGFAKTQGAYDEAVRKVFHGLDTLEKRLSERRYLAGMRISEADWRAFPTCYVSTLFTTAISSATSVASKITLISPTIYASSINGRALKTHLTLIKSRQAITAISGISTRQASYLQDRPSTTSSGRMIVTDSPPQPDS